MKLERFIERVKAAPETIQFADTLALIDAYYHYQPATFFNDRLVNDSGTNEGSCKIFAFGQLHGLNQQQTLHCFGRYYRDDVLKHPERNDHLNIRQFIKTGWDGIRFSQTVLKRRDES